MQLLAAISHDLRTPVTRMRLRVEMSADSLDKEKLLRDLDEMDNLVHHGIAYARGEHITAERFTAIDIASFIDSIAYDYQDTGRCVSVEHGESGTVVTRPQALRRVLSNLIDNALKFAGAAEIGFDQRPDGKIAMWIKDRGPGIPDARLADVLEPFVRINHADSGKPDGAGLGLAIARQLTEAAGGSIRLYNREGGGLAVELVYHGRIYPRLVDPPQPLGGTSGALRLDVPAKKRGVCRAD
jgi:signal transduction histidine kinase